MWVVNFLAALFAAVLAAMGVGGGGLLVIYLIIVLGSEQIAAQGINLIFFICASLCSLPFHIRSKRIHLKTVAVFAPAGAIGAYFGCRLGLSADPALLRSVFGWFLICAGSLTLVKSLKPFLEAIKNISVRRYRRKGNK